MIVARVWLDQQNATAYGLGFKKLFEQCKQADTNFTIGETLLKIVTGAETKGLQEKKLLLNT